ncbi:hypothetical protein T05_10823 [Trichinella murrelli]|uniref:Uncharacterized protein n=1 Tax=Trichinella murrelli TaxID=144512 RepID=A0A0V0U8E8_9BILA|nr:hypothetical protein T05_10823 [Trichinella murrelli]
MRTNSSLCHKDKLFIRLVEILRHAKPTPKWIYMMSHGNNCRMFPCVEITALIKSVSLAMFPDNSSTSFSVIIIEYTKNIPYKNCKSQVKF